MAVKERVEKLAEELGVTLESKNSWVREPNDLKWLRQKQMYHRLYWRLRKMKKEGNGQMNKLVFVENGQAVTDSLMIAETFGKEHKHVMRDIRELDCSTEFHRSNFGLIDYVDGIGRTYQKHLITQDGFSFLVMGYTGKEAARFKETYIGEFNRMREHIKNNSFKGISPELQAILMLDRKTQEVEARVDSVERKVDEQITLDHGESRRLQKAIATRVYEHSDTNEQRSLLFSELHREIKDRWGVTSYRDVKRKEFQDALRYVAAWVPKRN